MTAVLPIGLASWIIQDGNYPDFKVGQERPFALEFYARDALRVAVADRIEPSLRYKGNAEFDAIGRSIHVDDDWWVLDFGVPAYTSHPISEPTKIDVLLEGSVYVGVDHFDYFERLSTFDNAPALIFDWRIERIEMQTAPFIQKSERFFIRDPEKIGWRDLPETNAWTDDGGRAEYILHVARLSDQPRRTLNR